MDSRRKLLQSSLGLFGWAQFPDAAFAQAAPAIVQPAPRGSPRRSASVFDFGAVGDGQADDTAAIQRALDSGADHVLVPPGTFRISTGTREYGLVARAPGQTLDGAGAAITRLVYTSSGKNRPGVLVTADRVTISGITVDGSANGTNTGPVRVSNCICFAFEDVNDCVIQACHAAGGHYGILLRSSLAGFTRNYGNSVLHCSTRNTTSSGVHLTRACYALVQGCSAAHAGTDGFKTTKGTLRSRLIGNTAHHCGRDGFDVFDGFIESVLANNVSAENTLQGYEIKGTFGGTYSAADYVVRDSVISGNAAIANGRPGFQFTSIRDCTIVGNVATSNQRHGFAVNTVQGCAFTANLASRNLQHGFNLAESVSRNHFVSCQAIDNSWTDGVTRNKAFSGFNVEGGCASEFIACSAQNGTTRGKQGGQAFGFRLGAGAAGSRLLDCNASGNLVDGFGGAVGWTERNVVVNLTSDGAYAGLRLAADTLGVLQSGADLQVRREDANARLLATRGNGPSVEMTAQAGFGSVGTATPHPLRIQAAGASLIELAADGTLAPVSDGGANLGSPERRYGTLHVNQGIVTRSDSRAVRDVRELTDKERAVARRIKPALRAFRHADAGRDDAGRASVHFGVLAQDVESAFAAEGLKADDYGLFCRGGAKGQAVGIRYEQLLAFVLAAT